MCMATIAVHRPELVQSLAFLCVYGDKIAVHSAEIGAVIGLFMCVWWQNCWYIVQK